MTRPHLAASNRRRRGNPPRSRNGPPPCVGNALHRPSQYRRPLSRRLPRRLPTPPGLSAALATRRRTVPRTPDNISIILAACPASPAGDVPGESKRRRVVGEQQTACFATRRRPRRSPRAHPCRTSRAGRLQTQTLPAAGDPRVNGLRHRRRGPVRNRPTRK